MYAHKVLMGIALVLGAVQALPTQPKVQAATTSHWIQLVKLYRVPDFRDEIFDFQARIGECMNLPSGMDDAIESFDVGSGTRQCYFYNDKDCKGAYLKLGGKQPRLPEGHGHSITSIKCPQ
ncbi:hypothetical protein SCUP515_01161 [Seiridium cupressi]